MGCFFKVGSYSRYRVYSVRRSAAISRCLEFATKLVNNRKNDEPCTFRANGFPLTKVNSVHSPLQFRKQRNAKIHDGGKYNTESCTANYGFF